jgi:hypothetical protein
VKFGTILLEPHTSNSDADLAYLTAVTAAAYIRLGQLAPARNLLKEQWSQIRQPGIYEFPLVNLIALTQAGGSGSPHGWAPARPK